MSIVRKWARSIPFYIPLIFLSTLSLVIGYKIKPHFNVLKNIENVNPEELIDFISEGNDFKIQLERIDQFGMPSKVAGINFKNDNIEVVDQGDAKFIADNLEKSQISPYWEKNGGIKRVLNFNSKIIAEIAQIRDDKCLYVSLFNLTDNIEFLRGKCLPKYDDVDFNGAGGGYAISGDNLIFAIGTPTTDENQISNLAQDPQSIYGKTLLFNTNSVVSSFETENYKIFTSGHRNPQSIKIIGNNIYLVEHGPRGGDELNLLSESNNYGWPLNSFGSRYAEDVNYPIDIADERFTTPIFSWIPSIAPSSLTDCPAVIHDRYTGFDCLILSTLRDMSLYILLIDPIGKRLISYERFYTGMRLRHLFKYRDVLYVVSDGSGIFKISAIKK